MSRTRAPRLLMLIGAALTFYAVLYVWMAARDYGGGRQEFYHFRNVKGPALMYFFAPAAFIESRLIWIIPEPFLPHPSWVENPQVLILRGAADHRLRFRASANQE